MRLGVSFSDDVPLADQRALARRVEHAGLSSMWANDSNGRDPFLLCQAWAAATERLVVGVGVAQIPTRTPAQVAKAAATLQEATGGRFVLGLGVSQPSALERWHGVHRPPPLATVGDAIAIIGALTRGETTAHDGTVLRSHDFRLAITPRAGPVPLYVGAMGPKMLALAGAVADGVLLSWESPAAVRHAAAAVHAAAAAADRPPPEIAAYVRVAVAEDRAVARRALATEVARFWTYYGVHFARQGLGPSVAAAAAVVDDGPDAIARVLDDEALAGLGFHGGVGDDPGPFLARYAAAGVDHVIARSLDTGDPVASMDRVLAALSPYASRAGAAPTPRESTPAATR